MPPPYRCVAIELLLKSRNSPQEAIGLHCKTIYSATVALVAQHRFCEFTATPATVLCVCAAFYGGGKLSSLRRRHRLALPASTFDGTGYVRNFFLFSRRLMPTLVLVVLNVFSIMALIYGAGRPAKKMWLLVLDVGVGQGLLRRSLLRVLLALPTQRLI